MGDFGGSDLKAATRMSEAALEMIEQHDIDCSEQQNADI